MCEEMTRKMRKDAEQAYTISAFDYVSNPVGSRDWELYWKGYQAAIAVIREGTPAGFEGNCEQRGHYCFQKTTSGLINIAPVYKLPED